jgi:hypothetical protein
LLTAEAEGLFISVGESKFQTLLRRREEFEASRQ